MKKALQYIKRKQFSFFKVFLLIYLLIHAIWTAYILCNFNAWTTADEDLNAYIVILFFILAPIGVVAYAMYEKFQQRKLIYICPFALFALIELYCYSRFGVLQWFDIFTGAALAGLYALNIFVASCLAAPPEHNLYGQKI